MLAQKYADKKYYLVDSLNLTTISQPDKIMLDSCLKIFHQTKTEETRFKSIDFVVENCWDKAVWPKYNNWLHNYAKVKLKTKLSTEHELLFKSMLSTAYNNKGYLADELGKHEWALKYYHNSLAIDKELGNKKGVAQILNNIAGVYIGQAKVNDALQYLEESLKIREEIKDSNGITQAMANIGSMYQDQGDNVKGLAYMLKAVSYVAPDNYPRLSPLYHNIAGIYVDNKQYELAYEYLNKSLEMSKQMGDMRGYGEGLLGVGSLISKSKVIPCDLSEAECIKIRKEKALEYYLKSLEAFKLGQVKAGESNALSSLGSIYSALGKDKLAEQYLIESINLSRSIKYPNSIKNSAEILSRFYEKKGRDMEALDMYKLFIEMRDSMNNESTQKATAQHQAKYEYEKQKAVDDAEHEKQIAIEQEAKSKQKIITYATATGLGLVAIFLLFVFNRLQVTRKQKNTIESQKQEVEQQKTVVELAHTELEEKNKEITDSIQYAKRIQNAILPALKVVKEYLTESFILYKPKDIVAGDFYWMESVSSSRHSELDSESPNEGIAGQARNDDNLVLFAAADCTGHGVPGAMVSVVCNNGLNRSVREFGLTDPGEILNKTREIVIAEFEKSEDEVKDGMDIALCSLEGNTLKYAGANNPLWIIRKQEARDKKKEDINQQLSTSNYQLIEIKANKQPIGQFDNPEPYTTHTIELQKGDTIYIFSDGYADQFGGEKGKKLKTANFKQLLLSVQTETMDKQKELIDKAFESWKGEIEQLDDVCIIGVRI